MGVYTKRGFCVADWRGNLIVSFMLTLWVALRSREAKIDSWLGIFQCAWQQIRAQPMNLFYPKDLPADAGEQGQAEKHGH